VGSIVARRRTSSLRWRAPVFARISLFCRRTVSRAVPLRAANRR